MADLSDAFSGFSTDDIPAAKEFYGDKLGLDVSEENGMLLLHVTAGALRHGKPYMCSAAENACIASHA